MNLLRKKNSWLICKKQIFRMNNMILLGKNRKLSENQNVRLKYYKENIIDNDAKFDGSFMVRSLYYRNNPEDKDAKYDKDAGVRAIYYKNNILDWDGIKLEGVGENVDICLSNKKKVEKIINRKVNHASELSKREVQLVNMQVMN